MYESLPILWPNLDLIGGSRLRDTAAHEQMLARYLEAATEISQSSDRDGTTLGTSHATEVKATEAISPKPKSLDQGQDAHDATVIAATELLARQARILTKLHNALVLHPEQTDRVNEGLLGRRINDIISISKSKFYSYRYDLLPVVWRQIHTDAVILETHHFLLRQLAAGQVPEWSLGIAVESLDRALITTGGAGKQQWIETTLGVLENIWQTAQSEDWRPAKRQKTDPVADGSFSLSEPHGRPTLDPEKECPRYSGWTIEQFEDYMNDDGGSPWPIVFTDLIKDWPALKDRPWKSPQYLLSKTFGGRRLVPVEIGRSYVDDGWGQELIQFRKFIDRYMSPNAHQIGYLAQHNLFQQIPSLRNDICVPDFCWVDVPPHPTTPSANQPPVSVPQLNAWFGPAKTITPLHTDGYHNLLCQAVGTKYLRLYPPQATPHMRPRAPEHGVNMSNTSGLDVGVLEGWDERPEGMSEEELEEMRRELKGVEYRECVLGPGDTLVIPIGWWHYVRSLSVSFSVSFWWN